MAKLSIERVIKIYDDTGSHFYVGPDGDGLECVEIRDVDKTGKIEARIFLSEPSTAVAVAKAIIELYEPKEN